MKKLEFTSSYGDLLIISENKLSVTNKFGDTYTGYLDKNNKPVAKSAKGLGYISRAFKEYVESK
jgi:hypothetical protein|nr:MAG TPA: hypothetical protein [Caudoviricetes sp.]